MHKLLLSLLIIPSFSWGADPAQDLWCADQLIRIRNILQQRGQVYDAPSLEDGYLTRDELKIILSGLESEALTQLATLLDNFHDYLQQETANVAYYKGLLLKIPRQIRADTSNTILSLGIATVLLSAGYNPFDFIRPEFYEYFYAGDARILNHIPANMVYFAPVLMPLWCGATTILKVNAIRGFMPKPCEFNCEVNQRLEDAVKSLQNVSLYGDMLTKILKFAAEGSDEIFTNDETHKLAKESNVMSWLDWVKLSFLPR